MNTPRFTCITCRVAFHDPELQRLHYKTDWHRYNLKRKVAELPPVNAEEFQRRVLSQRDADEAISYPVSVYCNVCHKNFNTQNTYDNHINSKKHKEMLTAAEENEDAETDIPMKEEATVVISKPSASIGNKQPSISKSERIDSDSDIEEVDSDEWDDEEIDNPILNNDCLFCSNHSASMVKNLTHMTVAHSFFVPDVEYVVDMQGLLVYLGEKVFEGYMCLWCNDTGRAYLSAEAAQAHMRDKGHTKILHDGAALAEYADFYDYSSSYPDHGAADVDEEVTIEEIDGADYELTLPSGATIGHRSLMKYYKQRFDPNRVVVLRKKLHKVLCAYRALGWTATEKSAVAKKARDVQYMQRIQKKQYAKLGIKANKLQTYYRPQILF